MNIVINKLIYITIQIEGRYVRPLVIIISILVTTSCSNHNLNKKQPSSLILRYECLSGVKFFIDMPRNTPKETREKALIAYSQDYGENHKNCSLVE